MKYLGMAIGICLVCAGAFAREKTAGSNAITPTVPSPCIVWGKPLRGGSIRVGCVAPRYTLRDAVELAQRLDIELETVGLWDAAHAGCDPDARGDCAPGLTEAEVWEQMRGVLAHRPEVLIAANFDLSVLPEDIQNSIAACVGAGCGLLLAHHERSHPSALQTLIDALDPAEDAGDILRGTIFFGAPEDTAPLRIRAARLGEGRIVQLRYAGDAPKTHCLIPAPEEGVIDPGTPEDAFSAVARAVRWACGAGEDAMISGIVDASPAGPAEEEIPPDLPTSTLRALRDSALGPATRPFRLEISRAADRNYQITVELRRPEVMPDTVYVFESALPKGSTQHLFELPVGPGRYLMDAWIADKKGVLDWHTQAFDIPGWPDFSNLSFDKWVVSPHDALGVSVEIRPILAESRSCTVLARAYDCLGTAAAPRGRLVSESFRQVSHRGGHAALQLNVADLLGPLLRIEVSVFEGDIRTGVHRAENQAYRETRYVAVRLPRRRQGFSLLAVPPALIEFNARGYLASLAHNGASLVYGPDTGGAYYAAAFSGMLLAPEYGVYTASHAVDGAFRKPCLNDPEYRREEAVRVEEGARASWTQGAGLCSLGMGNSLVASDEWVCRCDACLAGFRAAWRARCPSLEGINAFWGTAFTTWEAIDGEAVGFPETGEGLGPFIAYREYMNESFSGFHRWIREAVRAGNKELQCGFRALPGEQICYGYDWARLARDLDFVVVNWDAPAVDKIRSYAAPGAPMALAWGDFCAPAPDQAWRLPWRAVLHGFPMLWAMRPYGDRDHGAAEALVLPDGRIDAHYASFFRAMQDLSGGLGGLLLAATPQAAEIAIYDSPVNAIYHAAAAPFSGGRTSSEAAFQRQLERLGFAYDYVDKDRLLHRMSAYRVLVLPMVSVLDDEERGAIAGYAAQGGWVIADAFPGAYGAYGQARTPGAWEELFGVRRAPDYAPDWQPIPTTAGGEEGELPAGALADRGIFLAEGASAEAGAPAPVHVWSTREKGGTLLLNYLVTAAEGTVSSAPIGDARLLDFLSGAGCFPMMRDVASPPDGAYSCFRLKYDAADILAWLPEKAVDGRRDRIAFHASKGIHAYDMVQGIEISRPHKGVLRLRDDAPGIVSLLPYAVDGLELIAPAEIAQGQRLPVRITIVTKAGAPGTHLAALRLAPRGGKELPPYRQQVICQKGQGDSFIPLALNDPVGWYVLTALDLLTGTRATWSFQVIPATSTLAGTARAAADGPE